MSIYIIITGWNLVLLEAEDFVLLDTIGQFNGNSIYILMVESLFITELKVYEFV